MSQVLTGQEQVYTWNSKIPVSVGDIGDFGQVSLDIQNRSASVAVPTVPTVSILPTVAAQQNIKYDPATGIVTFLLNRSYNFVLMFNCNTAVTNSLFGYAEIDLGSGTFVPIRYSARSKSFNGVNNGQVNFQSTNIFLPGQRIRFNNYSAAAMTWVTNDLPGTTPGTLTVPAVRVLVTA